VLQYESVREKKTWRMASSISPTHIQKSPTLTEKSPINTPKSAMSHKRAPYPKEPYRHYKHLGNGLIDEHLNINVG